VVALDAGTGAVRASGPQGSSAALALVDGALYAALSSHVVRLDPVTLAERWRTKTNGDVTGLAVTGQKVLAGRAKLQRGRYTLTVRVRDAAGNAAPARVIRFTV
jgi:hypothetical protein